MLPYMNVIYPYMGQHFSLQAFDLLNVNYAVLVCSVQTARLARKQALENEIESGS